MKIRPLPESNDGKVKLEIWVDEDVAKIFKDHVYKKDHEHFLKGFVYWFVEYIRSIEE